MEVILEKKWIAVYGSHNSGVKTLTEVKAWAAHKLAEGSGKTTETKAWICEVKEQAALVTPAIEIIPFVAEILLASSQQKQAA